MLIIEPDSANFVIIRNHKKDLELLGQLDEILGWPADSINLLANSPTVLEYEEQRWDAKPFRTTLKTQEISEVEWQAYQLVDNLASTVRWRSKHDVLLTSYHEIASSWFQIMLAYKAAANTPNCVILVDRDTYECFRLATRKLSRELADHLAIGWQNRHLPIISPKRLRFMVNHFVQVHPLLVRRLTLPQSLIRNDKRARNFKKRMRIRFLRLLRNVRAIHTGDISEFFTNRKNRIGARLMQLSSRIGQRIHQRLKTTRHAGKNSFLSKWQLWFAELLISSKPASELLPFDEIHNLDKQERVLITVSDSGSKVNLDPAIKIAHALEARGMDVVLVTDSLFTVDRADVEGLSLVFTPLLKSELRREKLNWPLMQLNKDQPLLASAIRFHFEMNWPYYMRRQRDLHQLYEQIARNGRIHAVLSINETLPLAVAFGRKAVVHHVPWVGHFPILVGHRPDGYFFPAPFHLAYGDQIRDHMIKAGVKPNTIEVVGAYTYDKHQGGDRDADRRRVDEDFPRTIGKKLVTVGTEAFPDPETELGPVLGAVPYLDGVHVVLKLHPSDEMAVFEAMAERLGVRDRIDIVKQYPIGQLLGASDLLIVVVSNIAIEAAIRGTPTLICDFSGKTDVVDFVAEGLSMGCDDPARVGEMVHAMLFDEATAAQARQLLERGIRRFNGPNDGQSSERIADYLVRPTTSWLSGLHQRLAGAMYSKPESDAGQKPGTSA